ncbi:hypothetical protein QZH41_003832 [Actinostola sp. cb2023]|nr:hypothetical protein QZH41_003832 [Actinostola sp. cb2023]
MNSSFNVTKGGQSCAASITDSMQIKVIKTILYCMIMITALMGNIFIIAIVCLNKTMRRTTNIFIANMAASDMFIAVVVIPRILIELHIGPWRWLLDGVLGVISCKFCYFLADFSVCISITSHAVIAVDRFWAIVYSLRPSPITAARRKYIIALIWLFSFTLHSPTLYAYKLRYVHGQAYCVMNWYPLDSFTSTKTLFTVIFILVFCIPVPLIVFLYVRLVISLTGQRRLPTQTFQVRRQRRKEDIVVLRKVVVMVMVFLISVIPINALALMTFYSWHGRIPCSAWNYSFAAFFLVLSNSAVNPCLCIFLQESYKRHIRKVFSWKYVMNITSPSLTSSVKNEEVESRAHCTATRVETDDHYKFLELSSRNMQPSLTNQAAKKSFKLMAVDRGKIYASQTTIH